MTWWIWIVAGIAMIVSEFAVPAFVICFFGAGAVLTGLLLLLCPGIGLAWQLLIFSIASIAFTLTGRKLFAGSRNGKVIIFRFGEVCGTYDAEKGFEVFKSELLKHIKKRERIFSENQGV